MLLKEKMFAAKATFWTLSLWINIGIAHEECIENLADIYPCERVDLDALITPVDMQGSTTDALSE